MLGPYWALMAAILSGLKRRQMNQSAFRDRQPVPATSGRIRDQKVVLGIDFPERAMMVFESLYNLYCSHRLQVKLEMPMLRTSSCSPRLDADGADVTDDVGDAR